MRLGPREMDKLAEQVALTIDKALSPHSDNPQQFVKDLSLIHDFLAKQIPKCLDYKGHLYIGSVAKLEGETNGETN